MSTLGVILVLFRGKVSFFPSGSTSSSKAIASDCIPSMM